MGIANTKGYNNLIVTSNDLETLNNTNKKFINDFINLWNIYVSEESQRERKESLNTIINSVRNNYYLDKNHIIYFVIGFYQHEIVSISRFVILEKNIIYPEKCVFVCGMTTSKNFRRKGFCSKCIKRVIDFATKNCLPIILYVKHGNIPAIKCYQNNNFIIVDDRYDHHIMKYTTR